MKYFISLFTNLFLVLLFIFVTGNYAYAQKLKTDSLLLELQKAGEDTNKVNILVQLSEELSISYPDSAVKMAEQGLTLSKKLDYDIGVAKCYKRIGYVHYKTAKYITALEYYNKSLELFKKNKELIYAAECHVNIGLVYFYYGNYSVALEHFQSSSKINEQLGNKKGLGRSYNNIGIVHYVQSDYSSSMEYYKKSPGNKY